MACDKAGAVPSVADVIADVIADRRGTGSGRPRAYLVVGPPGSGKSRLAEIALGRCQARGASPVHVDADKLRDRHPAYRDLARTDPARAFAASQAAASGWADGLRHAAIERRLDVVVEGLFKTQANTRALCGHLKRAGYQTTVLVKVVPRVISLLQIERRYESALGGGQNREKVPRRVDAAAHDVGYDAVVPMLDLVQGEGLVDEIEVFDRTNARVHSIAVVGSTVGGAAAVETLRQAPLTAVERLTVHDLLQEVQRFRAARNAAVHAEAGSALEAAMGIMADWD